MSELPAGFVRKSNAPRLANDFISEIMPTSSAHDIERLLITAMDSAADNESATMALLDEVLSDAQSILEEADEVAVAELAYATRQGATLHRSGHRRVHFREPLEDPPTLRSKHGEVGEAHLAKRQRTSSLQWHHGSSMYADAHPDQR